MILCVFVCCQGGCHSGKPELTPKQQIAAKLRDARALSQRGETDAAMKLLQEVLVAVPGNRAATELAIETQVAAKNFDQASQLAVELASQKPADAVSLLTRAFDWSLRGGNYAAAEQALQQAVEQEPNNAQTHRLLAQFLNAQGRRFEASEHVRQLIRLKAIQHNELLSLIYLRGPFSLVNYGDLIDQSKPSLFVLGQARLKHVGERATAEDAIAMLNPVVKTHPTNQAAQAFYGILLANSTEKAAFDQWRTKLPKGIETHPEYWSAMGIRLSEVGEHEQAVRAFAEAVKRDPTDRESMREMIASLESLGKKAETETLRDRLAKLDKVFRIAKDADYEQSLWIAQTMQDFQRPWESLGWLIHAMQINNQLRQRVGEIDQRHQQILAWENASKTDLRKAARQKHLIGFDANQWPLPKIAASTAKDPKAVNSNEPAGDQKPLTLANVAKSVGLDTRYESGHTLEGESDYLPYHINGGGIAVLDFDLDGQSDVYIAQAGGKPNDSKSKPNQLFRLVDGRFDDTTQYSSAADRGYAQGVCAADINQDGFADLLVGNVGTNAIYLNQGDGTFRRSDDLIQENTDLWTSCYAVGDLDGDHLPEIVEVNYIDDENSYQHKCDPNCPSPQTFSAGQDVFYRSRGDGTFETWKEIQTEIPRLGFGVVIANFDRRDGNDCFIANDGDLNHYWTSIASEKSDAKETAKTWELIESGNINGCSIGRGGNSQACMGVASGDFDRDGTLDLHITNYFKEPVNLFMQTDAGFFTDKARTYDLHQASMEQLGFGTQAVDIDQDGWLDLVVLNGHVEDNRAKDGTPFQMPPQLFRGSQGRFELQNKQSSEEMRYWSTPQLGRTLATLDFNRDGRMDLIASHLDQPIALLENRSQAGDWLQIELIGTTSERDAVGAVITVTTDDFSQTAWQTGGDGYMCTNESVLHFGVGSANKIDRVEIRWPGGRAQTFTDVLPGSRYLAIENQDQLTKRW